ncbi:uncharacterized protein LOC134466948 [Engraulis encrasicolus]|uniref:uncharacterized protein LOC134466948 n=1 Tax=Engraulis encrasicolus TaxID=184585 RepID=UPI002FD1DC6C
MADVKTCHICQAGDLEQLEELEKVLPPGFSHLLCAKEEDRAQLKVKLSTKEEVEKWLQDFQQTSGWTWRKAKTYPLSGRYNLFRNDYRCQHRTYSTGPRNTNCPATLFLALKRSMEGRRSRASDKHMVQGFLLYINIRSDHNHPRRLGTDTLSKRCKFSTSTFTQLAERIQGGHSPSSALDTLKEDGERHFLTASALSGLQV